MGLNKIHITEPNISVRPDSYSGMSILVIFVTNILVSVGWLAGCQLKSVND